ncbi:hypothetical protein GCM10010252_72120 [Streptomyces aureoverticillatus]|nr:hypothetical protein GCM10010252_72120 [Streptomyces aureoverticillatus]
MWVLGPLARRGSAFRGPDSSGGGAAAHATEAAASAKLPRCGSWLLAADFLRQWSKRFTSLCKLRGKFRAKQDLCTSKRFDTTPGYVRRRPFIGPVHQAPAA